MSAPLSTKALSLLAHIREGKVETAKAIVMAQILKYPNGGMTRREVQEECGLTSGSACGRINELVKAGMISAETTAWDHKTGKLVSCYKPTPEVKSWQS